MPPRSQAAIRPRPTARPPAATIGALAALLLAPGAAASFLQEGYDAAHTGNTPDGGPLWDDVAFTLRLPGGAGGLASPLILDGQAYVLVEDLGLAGPTDAGVHRVDLGTGEIRKIVDVPSPYPLSSVGAIAIAEGRLFVATTGTVAAYPLDGGQPLWSWEPEPLVLGQRALWICSGLSVREDTVYAGCIEVGVQERPDGTRQYDESLSFVVALGLDGTCRWRWIRDAGWLAHSPVDVPGAPGTPFFPAAPTPPVCTDGGPPEACHTVPGQVIAGISVIGDHVFVVGYETAPLGVLTGLPLAQGANAAGDVTALDAQTGAWLWTHQSDPDAPRGTTSCDLPLNGIPAIPTGDAGTIFTKLPDFRALVPGTGKTLWRDPDIGAKDVGALEIGSGFALASDTLYVTSAQNIYKVDLKAQRHVDASSGILGASEFWGTSSLLMAGGRLYARAVSVDCGTNDPRGFPAVTNTTLVALETEAGLRLAWRHDFAVRSTVVGRAMTFAVGEGLLVAATLDGNLTVVGRTAASIGLDPRVSSLYPAPGRPVRVDLSGAAAGIHGPPSAFRADWGDGTVTDWQVSPRLEHAFVDAGERSARFMARNDAGQTSSTVQAFHIGAAAPNLVSAAFSPERQEQTFFVLGLLVTLLAALAGLLARRRSHGRLQRELRAVDDAYARTRQDPIQCETVLRERKARAHGLLVDRRLTDTQFAILNGRIDELARDVRLGQLDERFQFLPMGMVNTLRSMLSDGRIERWERDHFVAALAQERLLTKGQKAEVMRLIDGWFQRDARPGDAASGGR